jgi:hypothetical protein
MKERRETEMWLRYEPKGKIAGGIELSIDT